MSGASAPDVGGAMVVALVSMPTGGAPPVRSAANPLKVLTARLASDTPPVVEVRQDRPAVAKLDALADRLADVARPPSPPAPPAPVAAPPAPARPAVAVAASAPSLAPAAAPGAARIDAVAQGPASAGAATGGLWGQIQPCWRNSGARLAVPVSIEVTLDAQGRLARAPVILRGGSATDETRLTAEATALQALSSCLPRGDLRFGGRAYRLDFDSR